MHIHAEGPAFFAWLPKMFGKRVVVTVHGIDWQREKWQSGLGSKFIHQGEKNAVKYADEVIVLSKGVQDYFKETYDRETHFIPNGVNRPEIREAKLITDKFGLKKDSYILFLGRLVPEKGIRYLVEAFKNVKTDKNWSSRAVPVIRIPLWMSCFHLKVNWNRILLLLFGIQLALEYMKFFKIGRTLGIRVLLYWMSPNGKQALLQYRYRNVKNLKIYLCQICRNSLKMYNDRAVRLLRKDC